MAIRNIRVKGDGSAIIFGYNWQDAFRRAKLNPDEWDIVSSFYED